MFDGAWAVMDDTASRFRQEHGLPRHRRRPWRKLIAAGTAHLHLFSEHVAPRPGDWPACAEVTGYCFLDAADGWTPPPALEAFLAAGPPPVYVGFGSMTGMEPTRLASITRDALRAAGRLAIIGMGWGGLPEIAASEDLFVVDDVPHEWLFPRVAAVVHHGGAGTTAAALRAGRPSVVVPFFADQPYWGRRLADLGAAPAPIPKRALTAARLSVAITDAVSIPSLAERSAKLGEKIRSEEGAARTADRALHHLAREAGSSTSRG
jgi:sterol 3beta-glucosyltransferase